LLKREKGYIPFVLSIRVPLVPTLSEQSDMNQPRVIDYNVIYGHDCSMELVATAARQRVLLVTDSQLWEKYGTRFAPLEPQVVMTQTM